MITHVAFTQQLSNWTSGTLNRKEISDPENLPNIPELIMAWILEKKQLHPFCYTGIIPFYILNLICRLSKKDSYSHYQTGLCLQQMENITENNEQNSDINGS